ncbi:hypothetical protein JXO59_13235, partial [candidate division KSB1 bacterium]|nr:hypothetical protein [candidate division KSB1 bacterium]
NLDFSNKTSSSSINGSSEDVFFNKKRAPSKLIHPQVAKNRERFRAIQKWIGYVDQVFDDTFSARLEPIKASGESLDAEIYIEEIQPEDHKFIRPGAVFYWSIGYLDKPDGRSRISYLRFRRDPIKIWVDQSRIQEKTEQLKKLLDVG